MDMFYRLPLSTLFYHIEVAQGSKDFAIVVVLAVLLCIVADVALSSL